MRPGASLGQGLPSVQGMAGQSKGRVGRVGQGQSIGQVKVRAGAGAGACSTWGRPGSMTGQAVDQVQPGKIRCRPGPGTGQAGSVEQAGATGSVELVRARGRGRPSI